MSSPVNIVTVLVREEDEPVKVLSYKVTKDEASSIKKLLSLKDSDSLKAYIFDLLKE